VGLLCTLHAISDDELENGSTFESLELDKAWHGLHFLLSGSAGDGPAPCQFLLSGRRLPEVSEHVAVQRHLAVEAFSRILDGLADEAITARYDPRHMEELEIYPGIWTEEGALSFVQQFVAPLRAFMARHSTLGHAVLVVIARAMPAPRHRRPRL
jgi:hypothetical protein